MSDSAAFSTLLIQLSKLVKDVNDEALQSVASGAVITQLTALVKNLDSEALQGVASGTTKLLLAPKGSKVVTPLVLSEVADEVRHSASESAIIKILDADARLTPAVLKQLAAELNVTLPTTVKTKPAIQLHIAQTVTVDGKRLHGGL